MDTQVLEEIGLTKSEIKVYLGLLEIGSAKKGEIVKRAGISSSKIYEVVDKLIGKGLASYVVKNKIKHFSAAPPSRIKDYLKEKEVDLKRQEENFERILSSLELKQRSESKKTDAEIYRGWKGVQTVYNDLLNSLNKGEEYHIFGANKGTNTEKVKKFYTRFNDKVILKKLKANIIFNENARNNISNAKKTGKVRYLEQTTPAEILIYKNRTAIILLEDEPLAVLIRGESIAKSFKSYFDIMWKAAKR